MTHGLCLREWRGWLLWKRESISPWSKVAQLRAPAGRNRRPIVVGATVGRAVPAAERRRSALRHVDGVDMPLLISGFGTGYVGKIEPHADGSYVTTEWIMFFYLPSVPLRSFRVRPTGHDQRYIVYNSEGYVATRVPLAWRQVAKVYALWVMLPVATIFLSILAGYLIDHITAR